MPSDPQTPAPRSTLFDPLWRRIAVVLVAVVWAGFECFTGNEGMWQVISVSMAACGIWILLIKWTLPAP